MMKKSLKMAIELAGWGAYGLRNESLSGVDWLGGCGGNWGNDVPNSKKTLHYYNRLGRTRAQSARLKKSLQLLICGCVSEKGSITVASVQ